MSFEDVLTAIRADERYRRHLDWGRPRRGHPEGTIRAHVEELERNLERIRAGLTDDQAARVRLLIHVHDTFKPDATASVAIDDPRSHASLARAFLAEFVDDPELLEMVQWHDLPYALWRKSRRTGGLDESRFRSLTEGIRDWDTFVAFLLVDGCTAGKSREPLKWFLGELADRVPQRWTIDDLIPSEE